jgi:hypothetical protein
MEVQVKSVAVQPSIVLARRVNPRTRVRIPQPELRLRNFQHWNFR